MTLIRRFIIPVVDCSREDDDNHSSLTKPDEAVRRVNILIAYDRDCEQNAYPPTVLNERRYILGRKATAKLTWWQRSSHTKTIEKMWHSQLELVCWQFVSSLWLIKLVFSMRVWLCGRWLWRTWNLDRARVGVEERWSSRNLAKTKFVLSKTNWAINVASTGSCDLSRGVNLNTLWSTMNGILFVQSLRRSNFHKWSGCWAKLNERMSFPVVTVSWSDQTLDKPH